MGNTRRTLALIVGLGIIVLGIVGCQRSFEDGPIAIGSNVRMHYTLEVDGQTVGGSQRDPAPGDPLDFTAGAGEVFSGLHQELVGLRAGDKKDVTLPPDARFGAHDPTLVQKIPRAQFGAQPPKVGEVIRGQGQSNGQAVQATVVEVDDAHITLDMNHPLAGKTLNFSVEILSVRNLAPVVPKSVELGAMAIVLLLSLLLAACHWVPQLRTLASAPLIVLLVLCGVLAAYGAFFIGGEAPSQRAQVQNRPVVAQSEDTEYVGSQNCRICHPHEHATWHASYHRTMTQVATPDIVVAPFAGETLTSARGTFKMQREADKLWVELDDPEATGTPGRVRRQIVLTTGSHHEQDYWFATPDGRTVGRVPFVWRIPEQRWVPDDAVFITPPGAPRPFGDWNTNCIRCHVTLGQPRPVEFFNVFDSKVAEFGIACEACHGPGGAHVDRHADVFERYRQHASEEADETIVLPSRLSPQRQSQVCGQCHSVSGLSDAATEEWLKRGFAFRPGRELLDTRHVYRGGPELDQPLTRKTLEESPPFMDERFWSDGMVRVSGREYNGLIESPCYQHGDESRGVLACLSCHQMHIDAEDPRPLKEWANDQLAPKMETDHACIQCHSELSDSKSVAAHTHYKAGSDGSRCLNCHMPYTTWGLLKAIRSHEIDHPLLQDTLDTGRPNACNLCHLDKTLEWTDETLNRWYGHPRSNLSEEQKSIAASILWMMSGDAGQRGIVAWHTRWAPAQKISGKDWMAPYLCHLLYDPYPAVRFTAYESLKSLPGFTWFKYDFVAPFEAQKVAASQALGLWTQLTGPSRRPDSAQARLLLDARGQLEREPFERLARKRNDRPVQLSE